nr:TPA_asm: hypothetical protein HUJ06_018010 [Nelumbo nucifera]
MTVDCIANVTSDGPPPRKDENKEQQPSLVFDASVLRYQSNIPKQFVWPDHEKPSADAPELQVPLINLSGFLSGDPVAAWEASRLVGEACRKHGFFLVVNHGVKARLIADAHRYMDLFFDMPLHEKQRAQRKPGESCGYASSFTGRFSFKLPWKETLSFSYSAHQQPHKTVEEYFLNVLGEGFREFG